MKRILLIAGILLLMAGQGWCTANPAGTYYVNQAGSGSGDGSSAANARSVANHNSDTWAGPSTIYLLDAITSSVVCPSSGADATHIITYRGDYTGQPCTISVAAAIGFNFNGKNYITLSNTSFDSCGNTAVVAMGAGTNNTVNSCAFSNNTVTGITGSGNSAVISNNTFTNMTGLTCLMSIIDGNPLSITGNSHTGTSTGPNYGIYMLGPSNVTFSGNNLGGLTLNYYVVYFRNLTTVTSSNNTIGSQANPNVVGGSFMIKNTTGFTSTNDTIAYGTAYGVIQDTDAAGISFTGLNVNNIVGPNPATQIGVGINCQNTMTLTNSNVSYCSGDGVQANAGGNLTTSGSNFFNNGDGKPTGGYGGIKTIGSGIISATSCSSYNNNEDGFGAAGTGSLTCNRCLSYNNGNDASATSGDGYTSHDTTTLNVYNSIAYGNKKSGIAITGTGNSNLYNNSLYNNYSAAKAGTGGGIYSSKSGGTQNIKNNITANHDLELNTAAIVGVTYALDNNCYYDSRTGVNAFKYNNTTYANYAAYRAANATQDVHSVNVNPVWKSTVTPDFNLTYSTPKTVYEGGADLSGTFTIDYAGTTRTVPWSIGAYEFDPKSGGGISLGLGASGGNFNPYKKAP